jgi:type II secretory pathway component GspD/PulD (secretin)
MRKHSGRISPRRLLWTFAATALAGCTPEKFVAPKDPADLSTQARPSILRGPDEPDEELLAAQRIQEERQRAEEARIAAQPKVTAAFVDLPIRDALFEISSQAKIPIVLDQSISGNVTLSLKDAPMEIALRMIVFSGGYAYSRDSNAYYVGSPDPQSRAYQTLTTTRVIPTYSPPKLVIAGINKAFASYLSHSEGTNKIVLTGPSSILDRLESEIRVLDRPPVQIQIETMVVETKVGDDLNLGVDYGGALQGSINKEAHADNSATTPHVRKLDLISKLALTYEILAQQNRATIHSHPKVVTTSGTAAEIKSLVETYVIINKPNSTFVTSELQIIKSGTMLKVTPLLTRNDEVELTVEPEFADVVGTTADTSGNTLPVVSRRSIKSTVRLKSGEVLIIGGLYEETVNNLKNGIPFLKDMPVLNLVAGKQENHTVNTELLIFVSPKVLK